jgi:hypothetical protein
MRKVIVVLALGNCLLAVTSLYLWGELRDARAEMPSRSTLAATGLRPLGMTSDGRANTAVTSAAAPATVSTGPTETAAQARQKAIDDDYRDAARRKLAQLSDPTMRAQMLEEWKAANLPNKARYARYLDISDADAGRLIDVLAELHLSQDEAFARCAVNPPCDYGHVGRDAATARQVAIALLLGADKQQRFEEYEYSSVERWMTTRMLGDSLPTGSRLTDEQSERLIAALADERKLVEAEIRQEGSEPYSFPMEGVAFTFHKNPYDSADIADMLKEAADYNERIHARAKAILTPAQLTAFEQMQDQAIVGVKSQLQQRTRDLATQSPAAAGR